MGTYEHWRNGKLSRVEMLSRVESASYDPETRKCWVVLDGIERNIKWTPVQMQEASVLKTERRSYDH